MTSALPAAMDGPTPATAVVPEESQVPVTGNRDVDAVIARCAESLDLPLAERLGCLKIAQQELARILDASRDNVVLSQPALPGQGVLPGQTDAA
ncbi:hypothetical protein [Propionibacterium sp.]|uniref:hypothetical protein n=1 Tax=Propionibacterium sp. TaxID=1977903 RepID=UPI0039EC9063